MGRFRKEDNPFRPGTATRPGYLAGREAEKDMIGMALLLISAAGESSPMPPIRIVGPRGVGKSTLLAEAKRMAQERGIHVVRVAKLANLDPDGSLTKDVLAGMKEKGQQAKVKDFFARITGFNVGAVGISLSSNQKQVLLQEALELCLAQRPLALLLDEAMEYDAEALGTLLQVCQELISDERPLALILAGTPKLDQKLAKTAASFIDRTEDMYINALAPAATREALFKPFDDKDVEVDAKALEMMAGMTDDYPFFTQTVGFEAWNAMARAGRGQVSEESVRQAEAGIKTRRDNFYKKIYGKMESLKLIRHAGQVMDLLRRNGGRTTSQAIIRSLAPSDADADHDRALEIFHELVDRGFIWSRDDEMEPGIPSFFKYCEDRAKKDARQK